GWPWDPRLSLGVVAHGRANRYPTSPAARGHTHVGGDSAGRDRTPWRAARSHHDQVQRNLLDPAYRGLRRRQGHTAAFESGTAFFAGLAFGAARTRPTPAAAGRFCPTHTDQIEPASRRRTGSL